MNLEERKFKASQMKQHTFMYLYHKAYGIAQLKTSKHGKLVPAILDFLHDELDSWSTDKVAAIDRTVRFQMWYNERRFIRDLCAQLSQEVSDVAAAKRHRPASSD